jgi:proline-specific peptidase
MFKADREGYLDIHGYKIFFKTFGKATKGNVLCVHGGPINHKYMLPLSDLAKHGYSVVFYDQLGSGESEVPKKKNCYTAEYFIEEIEMVRTKLELGRVHLIGSSWGGLLALGYALKHQDKLLSLVTMGGVANVEKTFAELRRLRRKMPHVDKQLKKYEETGDYDNPGYLKAYNEFCRQTLCRLPSYPPELSEGARGFQESYRMLWGPDEFDILGNMRYWDVSEKLNEIHVPALISCGRYDMVTPRITRDIARRIPDAKLVIFQKSAHVPMWEERKLCIEVLLDFFVSASN